MSDASNRGPRHEPPQKPLSDAEESLHTTHNAMSLAEQKRGRVKPATWIVLILLALVAMIVPYWFGRDLAMNRTDSLVAVLQLFDPRGLAIISWLSVVITFAALGGAVAGWKRRLMGVVAFVTFAIEQFLGGFSLLKGDFWYSTYVVFHDDSIYANAVNLGILSATVGLMVFAILFVAVLVLIKRNSPLNILTRGASALSLFLITELIALIVVLFGGLIAI